MPVCTVQYTWYSDEDVYHVPGAAGEVARLLEQLPAAAVHLVRVAALARLLVEDQSVVTQLLRGLSEAYNLCFGNNVCK